MGSVDRGIAEFEETNFKQVARPSAMASSDKIWHYEQVKIKDSEYSKKCGISGDCYFYVSKGQIKISQQDNKTSLDVAISRVRTWGASSSTFFLELGSRSPAGEGRLEMTHKDPNALRLLVRQTTKTRRAGKTGPGISSVESSAASVINENTADESKSEVTPSRLSVNTNTDNTDDYAQPQDEDFEDNSEYIVHQVQVQKKSMYGKI